MTKLRMAALATGVLTIAVLTGCAQPGTQPAAAPAATSADAHAVKDELFGEVYGTPEQRRAGLERQHYAWQAAMGKCMTAKGADFGIVAFDAPTPAAVGAGGLLAFAPQRADLGLARAAEARSKGAADGTGDNPALLRLTGDQAEQWIAIQNGCEPARQPQTDARPARAAADLSYRRSAALAERTGSASAPTLGFSFPVQAPDPGVERAADQIGTAYGVHTSLELEVVWAGPLADRVSPPRLVLDGSTSGG